MATQTLKKADPQEQSTALVPNTTTIESKMGRTMIHHDVVAKMAGLAVREVEGVHELVPSSAVQRIASLAQTLGGDERKDMGVHVEVGQVEAAVDVRLITIYGVPIPKIAREIQQNVSRRIEEMTGLKVKEVNVEVTDLYFKEDEARAQKLPAPSAEPRVR